MSYILYLPKDDGVIKHDGSSFRELARAWEKEGYVSIKEVDGPYSWLGSEGDVLLYDYDRLDQVYDVHVPAFKIGLFANTIPTEDRFPLWKISPWIFWSKHVIENQVYIPYDERKYTSTFIGTVSTDAQAKYRLSCDWSKGQDIFSLKDKRNGEKEEYTYNEYIDVMANSKYGLSLRGFGAKCLREIEMMAYGTVPILGPHVDVTYYDSLKEGIHYLRAHSPDDVSRLIQSMDESKWKKMSKACLEWWKANASVEGSFQTTMKIIEEMRPKVDVVVDRTEDIISLLKPMKVDGFTKVRMGRLLDGGYVIPIEILGRIDVLLSYGIADDVSFELDFIKRRRVPAHLYDHTIDGLPPIPDAFKPFITWHKEGISHEEGPNLGTFNKHASMFPGKTIFLKIDVEGAEWNSLPVADLSNVACIGMEIHWLNRCDQHESYLRMLHHIGKDFILYHIHGNNYGGVTDGISNVLELTYINKKYATSHHLDLAHYPQRIDTPNGFHAPDLELPWLGKNMMREDWFSKNVSNWWAIFRAHILRKTYYLEIGSFEGRSLSWVCRHLLKHPESRAWAIDTWEGSTEHGEHQKDGLYHRYLESIHDIQDMVTSIKSMSRDALKLYTITCREYDIIYIDGDHHARSAMEDAVLSFPLLKKGGILVFDDYRWGDIKSLSSPHIGINCFITTYRDQMDLLHVGEQVFLRKK